MNKQTLVEFFKEVGFSYEYPGYLANHVNDDFWVTVGENGGGGCSLETPAHGPVSVQYMTDEGEDLGGDDYPDAQTAWKEIQKR